MVFVEYRSPIRSYLYTRKKLQKSKYVKKETVNVFRCLTCPEEVHLRLSDLKKCSDLCRKCADKKSAVSKGKKYRKRPFEALFNIFKRKTIKDGKDNSILYKEFLEFTKQKKCHYCHDSIYWTEFNVTKNGSSYNLDRKDNLIGYIKDNCVVCCTKCNRAKSKHYSYEEWYGMTSYFRK